MNNKISFGFSKTVKKANIITKPQKPQEHVEIIDCLEDSEIKVKNPIEKVEKEPLVIPVKRNANSIVDRIQRKIQKNEQNSKIEEEDTRPDSELTIEELAARQLLQEARDRLAEKNKDVTKVHTLPLNDEDVVDNLDGEEPTIEDYENVPIGDYGLAMLRGMGWKEGMCVGVNQSKTVKVVEPELRPKGLGLGAQKFIKVEDKDVFDKNGKKLVLAKGAYAKIKSGPHKDKFCEVLSIDDDAGRIIVRTKSTDEVLTINELFVVPIPKEEYDIRSNKK